MPCDHNFTLYFKRFHLLPYTSASPFCIMDQSEGEEDDAEWKSPATFSSAPQKVILHFDLDCFYAQVEMIRNPALRNVPLGVQQKYIIVTCNYVARERGVTKLMSVTDAKEKCPDLVLVKGEDLTHYREMSYKVTELLISFCPLVERLGFDENFMDITEIVGRRLQQSETCAFKGHVYNNDDNDFSEAKAKIYPWLAMGSQVAAELRDEIHSKLGLTGCAGIAANKLLAKLVSGTFKPNQQTTLLPEDVSNLMGSLDSLRKVPGIGHQTAKRLQALGMTSIKDLQLVPLDNLVVQFGEPSARRLKSLAVGIDDSCVNPSGAPQSLSDEDSFKKMTSSKDVAEKIEELLTNIVDRMHKDGRQPQTFRLTVRRYSAVNKWSSRESRQCPIPSHIGQKIVNGCCDDAVIQLKPLANRLFHKIVDTNKAFHLTLINVCFSNLRPRAASANNGNFSLISFFTQSPSPRKTKMSLGQDVSNSSGGRCTMDDSNPHISSAQQNCKGEVTEASSFQPMRCGLTRMDDFFSVDCTDHIPLSKLEKSNNTVRSHLPPNVDSEVFSSLPKEIQEELMSFDQSNPTICTFTDSLPKSRNGAFQEENSSNVISRSSGSVFGEITTDKYLPLPGSSHGRFPGNVDPAVFAELPPELQKELLFEWRQDKPILKAPSSKKPTKNFTGKDKKPSGKSSQSNNLLKYFKPH